MLNYFNKRLAAVALAQAALLGAMGSRPVLAQSLPEEVQVGTRAIIDFEFDWGRDGVYCPTCNYGAGNSRLTYIDTDNNVWVGYVDYNNGYFFPRDGKGVLVDTNGIAAQKIGNGPEWMVSERGSELLYTRWTDKRPHTFNNVTLGHAYMGGGSWIAGTLPGSKGYVLPVGSLNTDDRVPLMHYQNFSKTSTDVYWRIATQDSAQHMIALGSHQPGVTRRWVPGTNKIIMTYPAEREASMKAYRQVFLYSPADDSIEQLTFDPVNKYWAFMWQAPEYNNEYLFFVMVGGKELHIYRKRPQPGGGLAWQVINNIAMPEATPFIDSPEPFVHNEQSWVFFTVSASQDGHDISASSQIAITGIDPDTSTFRVLTSDEPQARARRDPEYFITANGPYLYYNRYIASENGPKAISEGVFRIDTGLGPPQVQSFRPGTAGRGGTAH